MTRYTHRPARRVNPLSHPPIITGPKKSGRSPRLRLLMHPAIGPADAAAVAGAFLEAISAGEEHRRHMAAEWRPAGMLRVERDAHRVAASGKILHLMAAPPVRGEDA